MAFDKIKEHSEDLQDHAQVYFEKTAAYYKLWGFNVAMKSTTMVLKFTLILLCISMVLLFGSFAAAFALSTYFDSYTLGFLLVGAIYLFITLLLFMVKDKIIEGQILEKFSEIFFND
jgi:ABC-type multidrug transport system fused ATPase/permease subunit